ncbi:TRAP transporter substrate-binding protein DctP [Brevibacillus sp. B_LB10_24]|uniref:TRAP transporter substrate-binding protein n=1 Tax=Brevibacillus sp. B_LB10_24 TaxID=3380645 RepID=UPI0038BD75D0
MIIVRILKRAGLTVAMISLLITTACGGTKAGEPGKQQDSSSSSEVITLKAADSLPTSNDLSSEGIVYWMRQVEELTNGKVKFEHFPAEQLGKAKNMLDITKNKVTDVSYIGVGYVPDKLPLSGVGELPGAASSSVEATKAYWKVVQDLLLEKEFLKNGVRPMFAVVLPPYKVMTKGKPVQTIEDLSGLKLRSGGGAQSFTLTSLGATPVSMPAPDTYTALERKTIDGVIFPLTSIKPYQLEKIVEYVTDNSNYGGFVATYCINEKVWQSLPEDIQQAMLKAGENSMNHLASHLDDMNQKLQAEFKANGVQFIEMDEQNFGKFDQIVKGIWDNWAKELDNRGLPGTEVKDAFKAALKGQ